MDRPAVALVYGEDAIAGFFLLLFGLLGIVLYTAITYSMIRMSHEIVGFRWEIFRDFNLFISK